MDVVNKEAGPEPLSVKVPMLETDACVTESEAGLTDTAEPAAAGERGRDFWNKFQPRVANVTDNFNNAFKRKKKELCKWTLTVHRLCSLY